MALDFRYQIAPEGARSKPQSVCFLTEPFDTRLLRRERDQNCRRRNPSSARRYQIAPEGARSKRDHKVIMFCPADTRLLRRERDQNSVTVVIRPGNGIPDCSGGSEIKTIVCCDGDALNGYQIAPEGARSKRRVKHSFIETRIPDCSGGSEIKTEAGGACWLSGRYQIAPEGARSKQFRIQQSTGEIDTRLLRRERDQN